ncbi:bacteriocin [Flavobacterium pectinovorum]|uniref:bacteriocin n=1 Tax=Flavobacterium pectinovorum TaxID=29533 RepID=UPI0018844AA5|nr:bacteriocin [Flavobacterium pectinovorum]
MNLENLNLTELNAQEVQNFEGGSQPPAYSNFNPAPYLSHQLVDFCRGLLDAF